MGVAPLHPGRDLIKSPGMSAWQPSRATAPRRRNEASNRLIVLEASSCVSTVRYTGFYTHRYRTWVGLVYILVGSRSQNQKSVDVMDLLSLSKRASSRLQQQGVARPHLITSPCTYYHYLCDGIDDRVETWSNHIC